MNYAPYQYSKQLYIYSGDATTTVLDATRRNRIQINLPEPIICPDNKTLTISVVSAEISRGTWATSPYYVCIASSALRTTNGNAQIRGAPVICKVPVNAPNGYMIQFQNLNDFRAPMSTKQIEVIDLALINPDGSDVSLGAGNDWSVTLQIDYVGHV
jgi:hypothetical protein